MENNLFNISLVNMNRDSIHISIPTPCHESWESMDATERGAFCHSCRREVTDFIAMTDREVIEYLSKSKAGCGRFRDDQLNTQLSIPYVDNGLLKWKALLLGVLPFIGIKSAVAAPYSRLIGTDQSTIQRTERKDTALVQVCQDSTLLIIGKVIDEKGEGLIGASVTLLDSAGKKTSVEAFTDYDGNYSLALPDEQSGRMVSLKISYLGYASQVITGIPVSHSTMVQAKMVPSSVNVSVGMLVYKKRTPAQKIRYAFRHLFHIKPHQ